MKASINLYQAQYRPVFKLLSLENLVIAFVLLLLVGILSALGLSSQQADSERQAKMMQQQINVLQKDVSQLEAQLQNFNASSELLAQIETEKQSLVQQERLLEELSKRGKVRQMFFANYLSDLEQADSLSIWLSRIFISGDMLELSGFGSSADAMPVWLQQLRNTESFAGRSFQHALIKQEEEGLAFSVKTRSVDNPIGGNQ